jgi:polyisoprenoid-binding protein YceI
MQRYLAPVTLVLGTLLTFGFADPADNKPKASVANAAPESNSTQPAAAEKLVITPEHSKVEFAAAKVTRNHNGSFKQFTGSIDLVPNSIPDSRVTIDIQTNSSLLTKAI